MKNTCVGLELEWRRKMFIRVGNQKDENVRFGFFSQKNENVHNKEGKGKTAGKKSNVIFAGDLNVSQNAVIAKKQKAQREAMKIIKDTFSGEQKVDGELEKRSKQIEKLNAEGSAAQDGIKKIEELKQDLKNTYGITDDGEEVPMKESMKEYKQAVEEYDKLEAQLKQKVNEAGNGIQNENSSINSMKLAKLKSHPVVDAQKDVEKIQKEASSEVINMLIDEAKKHVDDKIKEEKEKAEKVQDKKKEEEEKTEKAKQKESNQNVNQKVDGSAADNESNSNVLDQTQDMNEKQVEMQTEIKKIIAANQLQGDDAKGIVVDKTR
jgi:hypothetical protein